VTPDASPPPADWYHDPDEPSRARYWDGHAWTELRAEIPEPVGAAESADPLAYALPSRRRRLFAVATVAAALVVGGVVAVISARPDPLIEARVAGTDLLRVRGGVELDLVSLVGETAGEPCRGSGAFESVGPGTRIEVRNQRGRVVAESELPEGRTVVADPAVDVPFASLLVVCRFEFTLQIPELEVYRIGVEGFGDQRYGRDELADSAWRVELALGP